MRMSSFSGVTALLGLALLCSDAAAQVPFGVGIRIGGSRSGSSDVVNDGGASFEGMISFRFSEALSVYAMSGGADLGDHASAEDVFITTNGHSIGLEATLGSRAGRRPMPWLHAGVGVFQVSARGGFLDGLSEDSPLKAGFDLGAGLDMAVTRKVHVTPAVRFVSFSADWDFGGTFDSGHVGHVTYTVFDVGLTYQFGVKKDASRR